MRKLLFGKLGSRRQHQNTGIIDLVACLLGFLALTVSTTAIRAEPVNNPPIVQMLVPGFEVRVLPVDLTNINNLRYRGDGKLYALGYDGNIWLLSDSTGDAMEDTSAPFFVNQGSLRGPIGMAVIPDDHQLLAHTVHDGVTVGRGVIVASKGKVSAIIDNDGDDRADVERVIATGWKEIPPNVDCIGIAVHPRDGSIYFGLGTAAYNNAYLLDAEGRSQYELDSDRGTIQRIVPDLTGREIVCTGIRFTIGMDFDEHHELFVSDQEGATWLPNGNPFDELLHIRPGLHYGFPPRHPKHLPNLFDEPSVVDYKPQHQSTCGMAFNRPFSPGGPIFGPQSWRHDLLVCGQSRGKLYRTQLIRSRDGEYTARNHLIGCLSMLTVDCCVSPRGDLIVACHSGKPDWGTGPAGKGKLLRIRYSDPEMPQPLETVASAAGEVRITFDSPLDPQHLRNLAARTTIRYGEYVSAGDRFESLRPGYAVVEMQQATPRYDLKVHSAGLTPDRRTLVLATEPQRLAVGYAIRLPGLGREGPRSAGEDDVTNHSRRRDVQASEVAIVQHAAIDLAYTLSGVEVAWKAEVADRPTKLGRLPHVEWDLIKQLNIDADELDRIRAQIARPGELRLSTQIDSYGWMRPAVQSGATLDYSPEDDHFVTRGLLRLESNVALTAKLGRPGGETASENRTGDDDALTSLLDEGRHVLEIPLPRDSTELLSLVIGCRTGDGIPDLRMRWLAELRSGEQREGLVAPDRLIMPWAERGAEQLESPARREIAELVDANWGLGRQVFWSEEAACAKCHVAHGSGANLGPDLSNLVDRDYESVLRDVALPDAAINPDYITYQVVTRDGRALIGTIQSDGDRLLIGDRDGRVSELPQEDVDSIRPATVSTMPSGLAEKLGREKMKHLLAFLLQPPPRMTGVEAARSSLRPESTLERSRSQLTELIEMDHQRDAGISVVAGVADDGQHRGDSKAKPLRLLLVAGKKDHGPGEHDYPAWLQVWNQLLSAAPGVSVDTAMDWPSESQLNAADTIIFYQKGQWSETRAEAIDRHLVRDGGLVYIHWAVEGGVGADALAERIGLASDAKQTAYRHGPLMVDFSRGKEHPITRGLGKIAFHDESYWALRGTSSAIRVLGTAQEAVGEVPLFWTVEPRAGRIFVSIPGHYSATFDDPIFRLILLRGIAWASRSDVERFLPVVTLGNTPACHEAGSDG